MKNTVIALLLAILVVSLVNLLGTFGLLGGGKNGGAAAPAPYEYAVYSVDEIGAMVLKLIETEEGITPNQAGEMQIPRTALLPQNSLPRVMNFMAKEGWELVDIKTNGLHIFRRRMAEGQNAEPRLITTAPPAPAGGGGSAPAGTGSAANPASSGGGAAAPVQTSPGSGAAPAAVPAPAGSPGN